MEKLLAELRAQRVAAETALKNTFDKVADEKRDLNDVEDANVTEIRAELKRIDARIEQLTDVAIDNAKAAETRSKLTNVADAGTLKVTRNEATYRQDGEHSFFQDIKDAKLGNVEARERLERNNKEVRENAEYRVTSTTSVAAFIPPKYLLDQYQEVLRYARPVANRLPNLGGINFQTVKIPTISSGLSVAVHSEGGSVQDSDISATTFTTVDSQLIAGKTDVNQQTLDYSGIAYDRIVFQDLLASYNVAIENFVLNSTTSNAKGLLGLGASLPANNLVVWTDSSPTVSELYGKVGQAKAAIYGNAKAPADCIIMTPSRAEWIMSRSDSTGRPLISPVNPMNSGGTFSSAATEGVTFSFAGLPVVVSGTMPTAESGAATPSTEAIVVARLQNSMFWENTPTFSVFEDVLSGTMQVRFRIHSYVAQTHARNIGSVAYVYGSGLNAANLAANWS